MSDIQPVNPLNGYITLPISTSASALYAAAVSAIAALFAGWVPVEGQLDTILLEQVAQMASESAVVASQVPELIFQYLGQLFGINPENGVAATAPTTWTMVDSQGYTVPSGTVVAYNTLGNNQVQFVTTAPFTVPAGQTATAAGAITITAQVVGSAANGIADTTTIVPVQQLAYVSSIVATATTSGGVDPETIAAYLNRLSNLLTISAPRPILPADFALLAQSATDSSGNSLGVARALAVNGLNPGRVISGTITLASSTALVDTAGSFTTADVGRTVTGTDIPSSTTIGAWVSSTQVTMTNAATGSLTGGTVTLGDLTGVERCVAVCGITSTGTALSPTVQGELSTYLQAKREINFLVPIMSPTVNLIDVTWVGVVQSGQNPSTIVSAGNAIISAFLAPQNWAGGNLIPPVWESGQTVIRYNALLSALGATPGMAYVSSMTMAIHGNSLSTSDITMVGDAPLPTPNNISGSAS